MKQQVNTLTWSGLPSVSKYTACVLGSDSAILRAPRVLVDPLTPRSRVHCQALCRLVSFTSDILSLQPWARLPNLTRLNLCLWRSCSCRVLSVYKFVIFICYRYSVCHNPWTTFHCFSTRMDRDYTQTYNSAQHARRCMLSGKSFRHGGIHCNSLLCIAKLLVLFIHQIQWLTNEEIIPSNSCPFCKTIYGYFNDGIICGLWCDT